MQEFLQVVCELDGRAYRTICYLLTRPGSLTKENYASRRISFDFAIALRGRESNIPELPLQVSK